MLSWLAENLSTMMICTVLIATVVAIITSMIKKRREGKLSCGCGCAGCPMSGSCHTKK